MQVPQSHFPLPLQILPSGVRQRRRAESADSLHTAPTWLGKKTRVSCSEVVEISEVNVSSVLPPGSLCLENEIPQLSKYFYSCGENAFTQMWQHVFPHKSQRPIQDVGMYLLALILHKYTQWKTLSFIFLSLFKYRLSGGISFISSLFNLNLDSWNMSTMKNSGKNVTSQSTASMFGFTTSSTHTLHTMWRIKLINQINQIAQKQLNLSWSRAELHFSPRVSPWDLFHLDAFWHSFFYSCSLLILASCPASEQ